jgi:NDP-hexose-3-ketoreductase
MDSKMKFVVVGCGNIAQRCAIPAILNSGASTLVCVVDIDKSKRDLVLERYQVPFETNLKQVLETYEFEAVYISTPNAIHVQIIETIAPYGKQILCEKPLASSLEDAERIAELGEKYNISIFEGYMYQFHEQHKVKKQLIADGEIGTPQLFQGWFGFPPLSPNDFRYKKSLGGGCVLDACAYLVHSARHFYNAEPINVYAVLSAEEGYEIETHATILLDFGVGRAATLVTGFNNKYKSEQSIWGSTGLLRLERAYALPPDFQSKLTIETQNETKEYTMPACNHFEEEIRYFVANYATLAVEWRKEFINQSKTIKLIKSFSINHLK